MVKQTKLLNYKPKEKNMKKKVLLVTLLVVAIVASCFAFTACNTKIRATAVLQKSKCPVTTLQPTAR